ncbi:MAG: branched-chain-amino-acid transaminase [Armatimonadetes bacterium]|nr:branched-chain-amino-acid transaminase [Armatimonadota bacterium]
MNGLVYLDGKLVPADEAKVSVFDHGLLYGDGVFEGIRAYNGRIFRLEQHVERLFRSAHGIMLEIPMTHEEVAKAVVETVRANGIRDGYIRLVVTRGVGDLGLDPRKCLKPTVFIIAATIELYPEEFYEKGLRLITCTTRRNIADALDPSLKTLNYLNNIIAKIETVRAGVPEGLMLNSLGYVAECTGDNIFLVEGGRLVTPPVHVGVLPGITRAVVMEIAAGLGMAVSEEMFRLSSVYNADECFLTGTAAELVPVVELDGRLIGDGKPGRITQLLRDRFHELVRSEGTPVYE